MRLLGLVTYNWPLKLAALALATLLYAGLIVSQNAQSTAVGIPIEAANKPDSTIVIGSLGEVTEIRYLVTDKSNVTILSSNFSATVDLSQLQPGPQPQSVRVAVASADPRIQVISTTPAFVSVHLEKVDATNVPVVVVPGTVPDGLAIRPPVAALTSVTVRGAQSDIARVASARAVIPVDSSGIDVDQDVPLTPVDALNEPVRGVEVEPATVHVTMAIFRDRRTATVPIVPGIVGTPIDGFEVASVSLSVPTVAIEGDPGDLANVAEARTQPVSLDGHSSTFDTTVAFDLPQGVTALDPTTVTVHVVLRPVVETRNFTAGIALVGARPDRVYQLSIQQVIVTIGGAPTDLDRLVAADLAATADVTDLDLGSHAVTLKLSVPSGLTVVSVSPSSAIVTISEPTASPAAGGSPAASPSAAGSGGA